MVYSFFSFLHFCVSFGLLHFYSILLLGILGMMRFGNFRNDENVRTLTDTKCQTFLEPEAPADLNDDGNVRNSKNVGNIRNAEIHRFAQIRINFHKLA